MKIQALIELDLEHTCLQEETDDVEDILRENFIYGNIAGFALSFAEDGMPVPGKTVLPITDDGKLKGTEIGTITFTSSE